MKIGIVICYIGNFPWYFSYFLNSCSYNSTIDFIIITDKFSEHEYKIPINVKIFIKSLEEVKKIADEKLGFVVALTDPYKLCDFKPSYGLLFSDLLKGYDFWGHGDIDVIFGNIRQFITNNVLNKHDLICVRHDLLTGYFLLFRNNDLMNNLFTCSKDYKKVLSTSKHYCFDETNFAFEPFADGVHYSLVESAIESMTHIVKRLHEQEIIRAYFDFHVIEGMPGNLMWNRGKLIYKRKYEVLLYHLVRFKHIYSQKKTPKHIPDTYFISPTRIYTKSLKQKVVKEIPFL